MRERVASPQPLSSAIAALLATAALVGLIAQFAAQLGRTPDALVAVWTLLRYFTILTNALVAVVFFRAAFRPVNSILLYGTIMSILLVGIVKYTMLGPVTHTTAGDRIADVLHHAAAPLLAAAYWLFAAPRGALDWRAPLLWAAYPLVYLAYALIRGAMDGKYPYVILDPNKIGAGGVAINCLVIAAGFLVTGYAMVALDRRWGPARGPQPEKA